MKTPKEILKEKFLLVENDKTVEAHTHLVIEAMEEYANQELFSMILKLEKHLENEATLITEAISDIITIARVNDEETAIQLIRDQFVVIDRQDLKKE